MRRLLVLGATGSIGTTALKALREGLMPDCQLVGLVGHSNVKAVEMLAEEFSCPFFINSDGAPLQDFIESVSPDITLNGIAGHDGLPASLATLSAGSDLALANKESVVMGGSFLFDEARRLGRRIIPVDSEHSAIYHLVQDHQDVEHLVITASGGPFLDRKDLDSVTPDEAANHPTWKMGRKISIDSSTLANKGLEVIEAGFLFNMPADRIEVTIHRQSIVHSMIRLSNGAVYAQLSPPDMTLPIVAAVNDGHAALHDVVRPLSFRDLTLTFQDWDRQQFPLLALAYQVLEKKEGWPIAYNAADEVAVAAFCQGRIRYTQIADLVGRVLDADWSGTAHSLEEVLAVDRAARKEAERCLASL